jgi:hypothetical protein
MSLPKRAKQKAGYGIANCRGALQQSLQIGVLNRGSAIQNTSTGYVKKPDRNKQMRKRGSGVVSQQRERVQRKTTGTGRTLSLRRVRDRTVSSQELDALPDHAAHHNQMAFRCQTQNRVLKLEKEKS